MVILCSVVIPTRNRLMSTERAIESILKQEGAEFSQIIVVDDASDSLINYTNLRQQDVLIRLPERVGGAKARNAGLNCAKGDIIYLLDSDDYFIERNFFSDHKLVLGENTIFYCDIKSRNSSSDFSKSIDIGSFFENIFYRNEGVACTSTLVFPNSLSLRFDEKLPKHQDWDLVFSFLNENKEKRIEKIGGIVYMDRADDKSISRTRNYELSLHWLSKVSKILSSKEFNYVHFNILYSYSNVYSWSSFFARVFYYFLVGKLSFSRLIKHVVYRLRCSL